MTEKLTRHYLVRSDPEGVPVWSQLDGPASTTDGFYGELSFHRREG